MANVLAKFREVLGVNNLISETQQMREYLSTSGLGSAPLPLAVTFPSDAERLRQVVLLANEFGIPLTPASSRFHYHPASSPIHNGILVDLRGMDKILEVDHRNRKARVRQGLHGGRGKVAWDGSRMCRSSGFPGSGSGHSRPHWCPK